MTTLTPAEEAWVEQLAGADALIEFGRWLNIRKLTDGICTEAAERLIELLEEER
ncbi:hypothetical protein [Nakamurella lactea]|uniref:hypothetical protein n=1 Tax=Nakamurella lactea TaxID=459515 RepID=UPI0003FE4689|nr:hypothetical protein [Nakamurella lactea]